MKFVKFGIFTLALGMFVASCGNSESTEEATTDSVATEEMAPVVEEAAPVVDSAATMTTDSAAAPAPEAAPAH